MEGTGTSSALQGKNVFVFLHSVFSGRWRDVEAVFNPSNGDSWLWNEVQCCFLNWAACGVGDGNKCFTEQGRTGEYMVHRSGSILLCDTLGYQPVAGICCLAACEACHLFCNIVLGFQRTTHAGIRYHRAKIKWTLCVQVIATACW